MKELHDKLLCEVMAERLSLFMQTFPTNERVVEYMEKTVKADSELIWTAIRFAQSYDSGFAELALTDLRAYLERVRPEPVKTKRTFFRRGK